MLVIHGALGRNNRMMEGPFNLVIGGEAGQGLVTIDRVLTKALIRSGYSVVVTQSYMSRIRGGIIHSQ